MVAKSLALLCLLSSALATCPPGTVYGSAFNKCYKYVSHGASFLAAEKSCMSMGGSLVSVSTSYENAYISEFVSATDPSANYWIGVNLLLSTGWLSTNGGQSGYLNWAAGQPSDPSIYQCGAVRASDKLWTKELCSSAKPYMCQIDPGHFAAANNSCVSTTPYPVTSTTPRSGGSCPSGHCLKPGYTLNTAACKCYKFYQGSSTNYNQSAQVCANDGGTMAVILSQAENTFISSFARNNSIGQTNPWIGLWCSGSDPSSCRWVDGSPVSYTNFYFGYPRIGQPAYLDEINQLWYSFSSSSTGSFICQQMGTRTPEAPQLFKGKASLLDKAKHNVV